MYVFWFNADKGRDNTLYCSKAIKSRKDEHGIKIYVDPNGGIPNMPARCNEEGMWFYLPLKEGEIKHRCFWLEEEDLERAMEIQNDHLKKQWLKATEQMKKLKERFGF